MIMMSFRFMDMMMMCPVSTALRLKRDLHFYEPSAKAMQHLLDHMVRPNAENLIANFSRQMTVS
jgi:hypothetical protein